MDLNPYEPPVPPSRYDGIHDAIMLYFTDLSTTLIPGDNFIIAQANYNIADQYNNIKLRLMSMGCSMASQYFSLSNQQKLGPLITKGIGEFYFSLGFFLYCRKFGKRYPVYYYDGETVQILSLPAPPRQSLPPLIKDNSENDVPTDIWSVIGDYLSIESKNKASIINKGSSYGIKRYSYGSFLRLAPHITLVEAMKDENFQYVEEAMSSGATLWGCRKGLSKINVLSSSCKIFILEQHPATALYIAIATLDTGFLTTIGKRHDIKNENLQDLGKIDIVIDNYILPTYINEFQKVLISIKPSLRMTFSNTSFNKRALSTLFSNSEIWSDQTVAMIAVPKNFVKVQKIYNKGVLLTVADKISPSAVSHLRQIYQDFPIHRLIIDSMEKGLPSIIDPKLLKLNKASANSIVKDFNNGRLDILTGRLNILTHKHIKTLVKEFGWHFIHELHLPFDSEYVIRKYENEWELDNHPIVAPGELEEFEVAMVLLKRVYQHSATPYLYINAKSMIKN